MRLQTGAGSPALSQSELTERCWADVSTCVPPAPQLTPAHINICCCSCKNSACNRCHHWAAQWAIWSVIWSGLWSVTCWTGCVPAGCMILRGRKEGREIQRRNWCCHALLDTRLSTLNIYTERPDKWHNYAVAGYQLHQLQQVQQVPPSLSLVCPSRVTSAHLPSVSCVAQ